MDIRLNIVKMSAFPKLIYRSSCKSSKISSDLFYGYWKADSRIYIERQRPRIANSILKEKNQVGKLMSSTFKTFCKAISIQDSMDWWKNRDYENRVKSSDVVVV